MSAETNEERTDGFDTDGKDEREAALLVGRFQAGDREAFAGLYTLYFKQVYGYMRVALKDIHEAEDAAQQVFTQALEALPSYEPRRPFGAWLFRIARNLAVDVQRLNSRTEVTDPAVLDERREREQAGREEDEMPILGWISDGDLLLFVRRLPPAQRQALLLRFVLDLPNREIAATMGRTDADVRKLQHRALRFLELRLAAVGHRPEGSIKDREGMRRKVKQATVLRRRRCALLGD